MASPSTPLALLNLPAEVLTLIINLTHPNDLVNFSVTCKRVHSLASISLETHRELLSQYAFLAPDDTDDNNIWLVLHKILSSDPHLGNDPPTKTLSTTDLASYPRHVDLSQERSEDDIDHDSSSEEQLILVQATIVTSPLISAANQQPWLSEFNRYGSVNIASALLLSVLPNLVTLTYQDFCNSEYLLHMLKMASTLQLQHGRHDGAAGLRSPPRIAAFANLQTLHLSHWDTEGGIDFDLIVYAAGLPCMREISGDMVADGGGGVGEELPRSNIRKLELENSVVDHGSMAELLKRVEELEEFGYASGSSTVGDTGYKPREVVFALMESAKHSLKTLKVVDWTGEQWFDSDEELEEDGHDKIITLRDFEKLEKVQLELATVVPRYSDDDDDDDDDLVPITTLVNLLPPTLEVLNLSSTQSTDKLLRLVLEIRGRRLPRLKELVLSKGRLDEERIEELQLVCDEAGIVLIWDRRPW